MLLSILALTVHRSSMERTQGHLLSARRSRGEFANGLHTRPLQGRNVFVG